MAIKSYVIKKFSGQPKQELKQLDEVAVEEPLQIWLKSLEGHNQTQLLFTTMRTPGNDLNLVKGWLVTSAVVQQADDIISIVHTGSGRLKQQTTNQVLITLKNAINWQSLQRIEVANSACGICGQQSIEQLLEKLPIGTKQPTAPFTFDVTKLFQLTQSLNQQQSVFAKTGGIHAAALFNSDLHIVDVQEDVGRHNALDKLIGANLANLWPQPYAPLGLLLSGRISFELVQKAAMANLGLIVALGAPSSLAIDLAKECDICLIGFVKSSGFNCYAGSDKLS
ncbi:formate dehydrogenase accessory sulfurtransferase FdhD [Paraglaciecola aestuariivivens]